jgi:hypothetical protein
MVGGSESGAVEPATPTLAREDGPEETLVV